MTVSATPPLLRPAGLDLFVVESPFQAISALEARMAFNPASTVLLKITRAGERSLRQLSTVTSQVPWDSTMELDFRQTGFRHRPTNLGEVVSKLRSLPVRHLFVGYYGGLYSHIINTVPHQEAILIDDGTAVLEIFKCRAASRLYRDRLPFLKRMLLPALEHICDGYNTSQEHSLSYFTIYDLPITTDPVYQNNCAFMKRRLSSQTSSEEVWLLGAPMKEKGMMASDHYRNCVRAILASMDGRRVVYIPHRGEGQKTLEELQGSLPLTVRPLESAVEFHLANATVVPKMVCGFFTSALFSISRLFGGRIEVRSYYLPQHSLGRRFRPLIEDLYQYYRTYGGPTMSVVDLDFTKA